MNRVQRMQAFAKRVIYWPLKLITFIIFWFGQLILLPIVNIIANLWELGKMLLTGELKNVMKAKSEIASKITSLAALKKEAAQFKYEYDGISEKAPGIFRMWPTWVPMILVFIYNNKTDNCDGAAHYTMWLWRQLQRNSPEEAAKFEFKHKIYTPYIIWNKVDNVRKLVVWLTHYIVVIQYKETDTVGTFSNGEYKKETADELATRYLKGETRFMWIK